MHCIEKSLNLTNSNSIRAIFWIYKYIYKFLKFLNFSVLFMIRHGTPCVWIQVLLTNLKLFFYYTRHLEIFKMLLVRLINLELDHKGYCIQQPCGVIRINKVELIRLFFWALCSLNYRKCYFLQLKTFNFFNRRALGCRP